MVVHVAVRLVCSEGLYRCRLVPHVSEGKWAPISERAGRRTNEAGDIGFWRR